MIPVIDQMSPASQGEGELLKTPSNFVTKREDAAAASKSFLRTCAPADGVDDVLSIVVSLLPQV
jgi:hypothetical protein